MTRDSRTYKRTKTIADYSPRVVLANWRKRKAFEKALKEPARRAWAQAKALMEREKDDFAMFTYAISFFPEEFRHAAHTRKLMMGLCKTKNMQDTVNELRKEGKLPKHRELFVRTYGLFDSSEPSIDVANDSLPETMLWRPIGWQSPIDVIGHEFCHFVDWCCACVSEYSRSFMECYLAERDTLEDTTAESPSEYFATAGWLCLRYPQQSAAHIPRTFKWFEYFWYYRRLDDADLTDIIEGKVDLNAAKERYWEKELASPLCDGAPAAQVPEGA